MGGKTDWTLKQGQHDKTEVNEEDVLLEEGRKKMAKLFVGNLSRQTTDAALNDFVAQGGFQVATATVIRDKVTGEPRGFGFVELADGEDMDRAIAGLNGQTLDGRRVTVNEARPPRTTFSRPFGGGGHRGRSNRRRF